MVSNPATGNFDLTFTLYNSTDLPGTVIGTPVTNSATAVTNGLFAVTLNFGSGVFTGSNYWVQIGVRTNGSAGAFTVLLPRQPVLPVPYAIFANSASNLLGILPATQLSGTLPSAQISGTYSGPVTFSNIANNFSGTFNGTFIGNGSSINSLNASKAINFWHRGRCPADN